MALLRKVLLVQQLLLLLLLAHAGMFAQSLRATPQSMGCVSVNIETANAQVSPQAAGLCSAASRPHS
jgi:hypothetical protein